MSEKRYNVNRYFDNGYGGVNYDGPVSKDLSYEDALKIQKACIESSGGIHGTSCDVAYKIRKVVERPARNRYGVDVAYFSKELRRLEKSLDNRTPEELYRYLVALIKVVNLGAETCQEDENDEPKTIEENEQGKITNARRV